MDFILIAFKNGKQSFELFKSIKDSVVYRVHAKSLATIPISMDFNELSGPNDFIVLIVENPYYHLEKSPGVIAEIPDRVRVAFWKRGEIGTQKEIHND